MKKQVLLTYLAALAENSIVFLILIFTVVFVGTGHVKGVSETGQYSLLEYSCEDLMDVAILVPVETADEDQQYQQYALIYPHELAQHSPEIFRITGFDIIGMAIMGIFAEEKFRKYVLRRKS
jgi:hypothetical protein